MVSLIINFNYIPNRSQFTAKTNRFCADHCLHDKHICFAKCLAYFESIEGLPSVPEEDRLKYFSRTQRSESINSKFCGQQYFTPNISPYLSDRIVGGVDANRYEFPWIVSMQVLRKGGKGYKHYCGGAVISDYYVLTAAHCAEKSVLLVLTQFLDNFFILFHSYIGREKYVRLVVGVNFIGNTSTEGEAINVTKIIIHQNWEMIDNFNDIALLRTERPIKYSINEETNQYIVNSICLPDSTDKPPNRAQVAGWGRVNPTAYTVEILQKATVPRFSWEVCKENFKAI